MSARPQLGRRERNRRTIRRKITEAAMALFLERGYAATTIDDIAAVVDISPRTVFRHFHGKKEIVLGRFDLVMDDMLAALRDRPVAESLWTSLRCSFDVMVALAEVPGPAELVEPIHRVVFHTPTLLAGYLQRLQRLQDAVVAELCARAEKRSLPYADDDPTPRAVTAAAFGCLVAAQHTWLASGPGGSFAAAVDRAMAIVGPRPLWLGGWFLRGPHRHGPCKARRPTIAIAEPRRP